MMKIKTITGKIILKSGLHIGSGQGGVKIGGVDSPVMRHPILDEPYIPGSSLKGKMRFLLEWDMGVAGLGDGDIPAYDSQKNPLIPTLFGSMPMKNQETPPVPTMAIFRDAFLLGFVENFTQDAITADMMLSKEDALKQGKTFFENKYEVNIDRMQGTVNTRRGGPRQIERVVAGSVFGFEISLRYFEDSEETYKPLITRGLQLLMQDALGGSGSRGYGRIAFFDLTYDGAPLNL
jgi:CRISPR-associated protein Csm3